MKELWQIRVKSFAWDILGIVITGVSGFLLSPDFASIVTNHFGETALTSIALVVITGIAKTLRNMKVQTELGSTGSKDLI